MNPASLDQLSAAWQEHAWPLVAALVIGVIVRASKAGQAGGLWARVPMRFRPLVPFVLGILSGISEALLRGTPWAVALIYGLISGLLPIGADQVITKPIASPPTSPLPKDE